MATNPHSMNGFSDVSVITNSDSSDGMMIQYSDTSSQWIAVGDISVEWKDAMKKLYDTMESLLDDVEYETGIKFPEAEAVLEEYKELMYE